MMLPPGGSKPSIIRYRYEVNDFVFGGILFLNICNLMVNHLTPNLLGYGGFGGNLISL